MELQVGINSYLDVSRADALVSSIYDIGSAEHSLWFEMSDSRKQMALINNSSIVNCLLFKGKKASLGVENLSWPRYIGGKLVGTPEDVCLAVVEMCIEDVKVSSDRNAKLRDSGIVEYKVGESSVKFSSEYKSKIHGIYSDIYSLYLKRYCL